MTDRQCGGCTMCCKLLPVRSLGKKANQRCVHQRTGKGCSIYAKLGQTSPECRLWNCRWLINDDMADFSRPDRSHYVIDVMPDFIGARDDATGEITEVPVVQIWCDPDFPDAHRDPALRAWLDRHRVVALVRYSDTEAFALFPPSRMKDGEWMEKRSMMGENTHTAPEVLRVLSANPEAVP